MQKSKKNLRVKKFKASKLTIGLFASSLYGSVSFVNAGEFDFDAALTSEAVFQQIESEGVEDRKLDTFKVQPTVNARYNAAKFSGYLNGKVTHLERDTSDTSRKSDYAEYNYRGAFEIIERLLEIVASGGTSYLNANTSNYLVSDFLVNSDGLTQTQRNSIAANSVFERGDLLRGRGSVSYSTVKTEDNPYSNFERLNNDTLSINARLENGDHATSVIWNLNGVYSDTDRSRVELGSFKSENYDGFLDAKLSNLWALRFAAQSESHTFMDNDATFANDRSFDSYGAGLAYRPSKGRNIALTVNKANSSNPENDGDVFPGVSINWAFSSRTNFSMDYGKRFYGDAANVRFRHGAKHLRTSLNYSETVRNFSQLLSDPASLGIFVCSSAEFDIVSCSQPSSLSPELEPGQQLVQILDGNNALEDNVVLNKSGGLEIGYQFGKVKVGTFANYAKDEYLAQGTLRETNTIGINSSYRVGVFTTVIAAVSFAEIEQESSETASGTSDNINISLNVSHNLTRRFILTAGYNYLDKSGDISQSQFGSDYTDQRLSVGITYKY